MEMDNELNKLTSLSHERSLNLPALLHLRGTFLLPGQSPAQAEESPSNLHVIPVSQDYLLLHTSEAVTLYHFPTQAQLWRIECSSFNFAYNSQQQLLALAPGDPAPSIVLWDLHTGQIARTLSYETKDNTYHVTLGGLTFSPDGRIVAGGMEGRKQGQPVVLWDTHTGEVLHILQTPNDEEITTLAFCPDGTLLAGGSLNHPDAWIWDVTTGDLLQTWEYPEDLEETGCRYDLAFNQEGTQLFSACGLAGLRVWDVEAATEVTGPSEKIEVLQVVVAPDGQTLAVSYDDEWWGVSPMVNIVERETWQWHEPFANGNSSSESFSPDGQVLATFGERGNIYLWEVSTGRLLATI